MTPLQLEPSAQAPWTRRMVGRGLIAGAPSAGVPDATGTVSIPPRDTLDRGAPSGHRVPVPFLPVVGESGPCHLGSSKSPLYSFGRVRAVVGRSEAPMDVVVDHADVLHERVHTGGPDEAVPLRFQL